MKTIILIAAIAGCSLTSRGASLIDVVRQVESPTGKPGDNGRARSHWQIHRAAWTDVNRIRRRGKLREHQWYEGTKDETVARVYAATYLKMLRDRITAHLGRPASDREIYVAYNWGVTRFGEIGFQFDKAPRVVKERAQRVANLTAARPSVKGRRATP